MNLRAFFAAALLTTLCFTPLGAAKENSIPATENVIGAELARHARTLSVDEMTGRGVDTPGIAEARDYIAAEFKKYGLATAGEDGYFQRLEVTTGVETAGQNSAKLDDLELLLGRDWTPLGLSASGAVEGDIVFVGYGITATDYAYDDYAGIDANGKIVVVLRYEPPPKDAASPFGKSGRPSRYAALRTKVSNARAHGARALMLIDLSPKAGGEELIPLGRSIGRTENGFIAAQVRRELAEQALGAAGLPLSEIKSRIDAEERPHSSAVSGVRAALTVNLKKITRASDNVVGVLAGSDPRFKDETIVIGAHYDHLGFGHYGTMDPASEGQIHHGADDNASGTAVLLSLAERFARLRPTPPRTIVFVAFTGEELGLYGSKYFADHPPRPIASTRAMINLDMVGRMKDNRLMVNSADSAIELRAMIDRAAQGVHIEMKATGAGSDHVSFHNKNVPAVHFYTGMHEDYHRPSDTWEKLNIAGMVQVSDVVFAFAKELAATREPLTFVKPPSRRDG